MNRLRLLVLGLFLLGLPQAFGHGLLHKQESAPPVTVAESSDYIRTGRLADMQAFLEALRSGSDRVRLDSIGQTVEGRPIQLAIIADPPVEKPEDVGDRMVVLLFGGIHSGEICGKEALLMIARDLALGEKSSLLDKVVVCMVPLLNADGHERPGPDNRPGQVGPEEMGTRENAQGLDLNRDYVKLEAPETRALVRFMNRWDPTIIVDTHTTNGSYHRQVITYQGPKNPAGDARIIEFVRDTMLPAVDDAFEKATGYHAFFYGSFGADGADHSVWVTYPDQARYGVGYRGLRNRISIISEAYAYASFKDRVLGTKAFCEQILGYASEHKREIEALVRDADRRTIDAGRAPSPSDRIAIRSQVRAFDEKATILGYEEVREEGRPVELGPERAYQVELYNLFVPTLEVQRPYAYVFPENMGWLCELLQRHGIEVEVLREDIEVDIEAERILDVQRAGRAFQGHHTITDVSTVVESSIRRLEPGWYVVRTGQKLGSLACYLLEARSADGLVTWNFFDDWMHSEAVFPVWRLPVRSPMTLRPARALAEDRKPPRRLTYDDVHGRKRVDLDGSPVDGLRWIDDEHYIQRKDDQTLRVHARSGRTEPLEVDLDPIVERLSQLPTIERDQARNIARRFFARPASDAPGVVFEHGGDLYYADADGQNARRLTSSPEEEELASLSPGGKFAAFVRNNDLWVVDVATGTERAITTGGTDTLRHGKNTWVYFEELYNRDWRAYWWSPDGRHIAYFTTDASMVPEYTLINDIPRAGRVETERYPRPGEPNPAVTLSIASVAGSQPREVDLSNYDTGGHLLVWVDWSNKTGKLRLAVQNREQTWLDLLEVGTGGGTPTRLLRETTEAWVEWTGDPIDLKDKSFLLTSERDGYKHIYHFEPDGSLRRRITEGQWEVRSIEHVDETGGWIYFTGMRDSPIAENFYRIRFDGSDLQRLTPAPGSHRVSMSPKGRLFIDTWSSVDQTPQVALRAADGSLLRMIDANPVYELDDWKLGRVELVSIPSEKGVQLEGIMVYPPDFSAERSYPIWFRTYAGPHAPVVSDTWSGGRAGDQLLASEGIVVFIADPYPASGKGARSAWTAYKQLGVRELEDIEEMIRWVTAHPWADSSRVGISGHSFGGFMTAFAMTHSNLFSAGIAGAPPTDWRDYDSIYTERYMLTPQNNPDGYERTSVVAAAGDLSGRLLLLHGMIDDNVHPQNSVRFIHALVEKEKQFELFMYPGRRHGIYGPHYTRLMHEFILRTMTEGQPAAAPDQTPKEDSESEQTETDPVVGPGT